MEAVVIDTIPVVPEKLLRTECKSTPEGRKVSRREGKAPPKSIFPHLFSANNGRLLHPSLRDNGNYTA